jgi:hypothetical protein
MKEIWIGDTTDEKIAELSKHIFSGNAVIFHDYADKAKKILRKTEELVYVSAENAPEYAPHTYGIYQFSRDFLIGDRRLKRNKLDDSKHLEYRLKSLLRYCLDDGDITIQPIRWK